MPFELGLAVAWAKLGKGKHEWFVFEARRHRLKKSLSDLDGTDPLIHHGRAKGVLLALANALTRTRHRPTVELTAILEDLKEAAVRIKTDLETSSLFERRPFGDLVVAARASARKRVPSLTERQE